MDNRLIGLWDNVKPLPQLVGAKLNGSNGHGAEKKALQMNPASFWLDGNPDYSGSYDTPGLLTQIRGLTAYKLSALAYACMSYRATKLTEPPLWIKEEIDGEEQWIDDMDHPLAQLLEEPNPDQDMAELLEMASLFLDGTGRVLLVKTRDKGNRVAALYAFSGDEFTVEEYDGQKYGLFRVHTSKGVKPFPAEDVVFLKNTDPRNMLDGLAPLDVALSSINIDEDMRKAVKASLRNQARPGAIGYFPQGLEKDMADRVKAELRANFAGVQNYGKFMAVEGTDKPFTFLSTNLNDLALGPVSENAEASVCSAFKVHPSIVHALIGIKNSSGFADTIKPATELFYDTVVVPTWVRFEKALTKSLLREADDNKLRFIRFDTGNVKALKDDLSQRTREATEATGYWTLNEQRAHTGKSALENDPRGDEIRLRVATAPEPPPPAKTLPAVKREPAPPATKSETKQDARVRLWRKFDVRATREESKYEKAAREQFEKEKAEVVKRIEGSSDANLQRALEKLKSAYTQKDGEYHIEWVKRYLDLIEQTFNVAGSDLAAELGFDFNLSNPRVQAAIQKRSNKLAGNVGDTTYQSIKDQVAEARSAGEGMGQIADRIRDNVFGGEITKARATTIARTETVGALNHGELIAARESGVVLAKSWLTQADSRVRESHAEIDGETVGLEDVFSNGLRHPGDQAGDADEVVNCRCTTLFETEEAE